MGQNASGVVNLQGDWNQVQQQTDLHALASVLQNTIQERRDGAVLPEDFLQLALMSQAKKHAEEGDGSKLMQVLSQSGRALYQHLRKQEPQG